MPVQPQNRPPMDYGVPPPPARSGMVPPPPMAGALAVSGGHVVVIECTPPMLGIGRISSQENVAFYGTDDESQL